ncbi:MAG: 16S rRNA (guanine(527)-N(7))-methyltransferase RsmG [Neisseriaceae bacterium]|nr:16S rRNA (guanine(527)-N(7))-methyltransferase RsmG [Neisseriaceae bacterium]
MDAQSQTQLTDGLAMMNLAITDNQFNQLCLYIDLLEKWNVAYNLTALKDERQMVYHHLLDSLSLTPFVSDTAKTVLDVGSGGGTPGIPLAIYRPDLAVTLVDSNSKKTAFLRQAVIELGLNNVQVITERVENIKEIQFDTIVSRAFAELGDFVRLTEQILAKNGVWLAMKGVYPYEEVDRLPENIMVKQVVEVKVPFIDGSRHIVEMAIKGE